MGRTVPARPRRCHSEWWQLLEHSPCCEREIRIPGELVTYDVVGGFEVRVRAQGPLTALMHQHQPPPVNQTLGGPEFGKERTEELAVMIDTFRPLRVGRAAREQEDPDSPFSWRPQP